MIIPQKLRIDQKIIFCEKIIVRSIPFFPVNLATLNNFFVAEWVALWRPITWKLKIGKILKIIFYLLQHIPHLLCCENAPPGHDQIKAKFTYPRACVRQYAIKLNYIVQIWSFVTMLQICKMITNLNYQLKNYVWINCDWETEINIYLIHVYHNIYYISWKYMRQFIGIY